VKVVHTYFTNGYFEWAKLFIQSFKKHNDYKLIVSSRNLHDDQIKKLKGLYSNIEVRNKNLDYKNLAKRARIPVKTLMNYKQETEKVKVNMVNKVWKLLISAEDRIREIRDVAYSLREGDLLLNMDVDSYIKKSVNSWFDIIKENDFTSIYRYDKQMRKFGYIKKPFYVIICCLQGYTINERALLFLDRWMKEIDDVPAHERPKSFGQLACYNAFLTMEDDFKFGQIPESDFCLTGNLNQDCILYGANKGSKTINLNKFMKDFK
jgi:hypothetical protein